MVLRFSFSSGVAALETGGALRVRERARNGQSSIVALGGTTADAPTMSVGTLRELEVSGRRCDGRLLMRHVVLHTRTL